MKKSRLALLLILAAALAVVLWAVVSVADGVDNVVYTQRTVVGDPTAAEGLTLRHKINYEGYLHWDSTLSLSDGQHHAETAFTYTADREYEMSPYSATGVSMWMDTHSEFDTEVPAEKLQGYGRIMREMYDEMKDGETAYRTARLKDVYEYYPIAVQVDFRHSHFYSNEYLYLEDDWQNDANQAAWMHVYETFNDYFHIPVLTDEEYGMSIDKRGDGYGASFGLTDSALNQNQYHMETYSAATDHGGWFIFNTHTTRGDVVDTSLIPGGYGIYYLPVDNVEFPEVLCGGILVDEMRCIYPMDPAVQVRSLHLNEDGTKLVVSYLTDDGTLWADVVAADDGTKLQTLELYVSEDEDLWVEVIQEGEDIVYLVGSQRIVLLTEESTGFSVKINVSMDRPEGFSYSPYDTNIGWDGERLAMVGTYGDRYHDTDITVAVYTAHGLGYAGVYTCSLNSTNYAYQNRPVEGYPIVTEFQ